jgi:hypothetical protein
MKRFGALLAAVVLGTALTSRLEAQQADSVVRFSLFGGIASDGYNSNGNLGSSNFEFGASGDFRLHVLPFALRGTLAFSQQHRDYFVDDRKSGLFSLDAVGHPIRGFLGVRPYLLGGLGVATQAEFRTLYAYPTFDGSGTYNNVLSRTPRTNWAFAEGGIGLELGRHLFVQSKLQVPVASDGHVRTPVNLGIRF